jgi:hypothetical protein
VQFLYFRFSCREGEEKPVPRMAALVKPVSMMDEMRSRLMAKRAAIAGIYLFLHVTITVL